MNNMFLRGYTLGHAGTNGRDFEAILRTIDFELRTEVARGYEAGRHEFDHERWVLAMRTEVGA